MSIITKNKTTTGAGASALAVGELAVNTADLTLHVGTGGGNELLVDANAAPQLADGTTEGSTLVWNDTSEAWEETTDVSFDGTTFDVTGDIAASGNVGAVGVITTGNVGVGVPSPTEALEVSGTALTDNGELVGATEIPSATQDIVNSITTVTQAEYQAIVTPDANTLYIITG